MPRSATDDDHRISLQLSSIHKARIARAATLQHMDVHQFVTEAALREANAVIAQAKAPRVSERDFTRIVELLENSPAPNARLKAVIAALPDTL
jgi:uncharacterized protein (DUF1778 family)